jgi:hypothetical protein
LGLNPIADLMVQSFKLNARDADALRKMFEAHEPAIRKIRQERVRQGKLKNKEEH